MKLSIEDNPARVEIVTESEYDRGFVFEVLKLKQVGDYLPIQLQATNGREVKLVLYPPRRK